MKQEICLICNDKRKYETEVSQTRNILFHLNQFVKRDINNEFSEEEKEVLRQLGMYNKHPHFMCGNCYRINLKELSLLEKKIDNLLIVIARNINDKNKDYHDVLRLLSGAYSGKYHIFESYCLRKITKEQKENNE